MKTRLLIIIGISVVITISLLSYVIYDSSTTVFVSCDPRYEQIDDKCILKISETDYEELECLRLYKDIREISRTDGFALAEREIINLHKDLVFEYVEKKCIDFPDLDFIYNGYKQNIPEIEPVMQKAKDLGINNIMNAVDSEDLSLDEKIQYIKIRYEESPNLIPSLNIRIKDFTRNLEYGETPTFTVIETGYAYPCTSPKLEVYHLKGETGYDLENDELVYEDRIVYPCPYYDSFSPVLKFWNEQDFDPFPTCEKEGRYLVVGDSGHEKMALEEYYCNAPNGD